MSLLIPAWTSIAQKKVQTNENREMLSILRFFFFKHTEILSQTKKEAATYSCNQL